MAPAIFPGKSSSLNWVAPVALTYAKVRAGVAFLTLFQSIGSFQWETSTPNTVVSGTSMLTVTQSPKAGPVPLAAAACIRHVPVYWPGVFGAVIATLNVAV